MAEIIQNNTEAGNLILPAWYYKAFGLRLKGLTYSAIAEEVGKSESHVRLLFSKNGKLYAFWRKFVDESQSESLEESRDMIFGHLPDITRAAVMVAKNTMHPMGVRQRDRLFDMTHGKTAEKVDLTVRFSTTDLVKRVAERRKQEQNNADGSGTRTISSGLAE